MKKVVDMNSEHYILITPCKNESVNLPSLIESVVSQTNKPVLWVIVDDGSTDDTPKILKEAAKKYNWINILKIENTKRDLGLHYAEIVKRGFDYALSYCRQNKIEYNYLGNLDADLILNEDFYEKLTKEFMNDHKLGIASGGTKHIIGERIKYARASMDEPSGGHMLIRKELFNRCGGIPITYSIDSVLKAKARLGGWKTRRFEKIIVTEIRDVNAAEGYYKGFIQKAQGHYYLNFHPLHILVKSMKFSFEKPYYVGIVYLASYLNCFIFRRKQIEDPIIRNYFWNKWRKKLNIIEY